MDNISKYLLLAYFLLLSTLGVSQELYQGVPCSVCDMDCIECSSFTQIVNLTDVLLDEEGSGDSQNTICSDMDLQVTWYGFIAGSEDIEFTVSNVNCLTGASSDNIHIAVYEGINCSNLTQVSDVCYGSTTQGGIGGISEGDTETLSMTNLVVGQNYWIVINTDFATGTCAFTIDVTAGQTGNGVFIEEIQPVCTDEVTQVIVQGLTDDIVISGVFSTATFINEESTGIYSVSFDNAESGLVSFIITDPLCGDYTISTEVPLLEPPQLNLFCAAEATSTIIIEWNSDPGYTSYDILVDGVFETNTQDTSFLLGNLATGISVDFTVIANGSGGDCPADIQTITCETIECSNFIEVNVTSPMYTLLCSNDEFELVPVFLQYDMSLFDGTETIEWTGGGVTADGIFDPNQGFGDYTIFGTLVFGECEYTDQLTFRVETLPVLSLDAPTEICLGDPWQLIYDGEIDPQFSYTWETDFGQNLMGLGPHNIDFQNTGTYSFTLEASRSTCDAVPVTIEVAVRDSVRTPVVQCMVVDETIELEWSAEDSECNQGYDIVLNGAVVESDFNGTSFTLIDLEPNVDHEIEIVNKSICACPSKSASVSCFIETCPLELTLASESTAYCLDDVMQSVALAAELSGDAVIDNISWSGTGIDGDGVIDLSQISPGTILYSAVHTIDDCVYPAEIEISFAENAVYESMVTIPTCPEDGSAILIIEGIVDPEISYMLDGELVNPNQEINLEAGTYELVVTSGSVCIQSETIVIDALVLPDLSIVGPASVDFGEGGDFELINNADINIQEVIWFYNDTLIASIDNLIFDAPGMLCATVSYNDECMTEVCRTIQVENPNVYIPNIISLAEGSLNDSFTVFSNDANAVAEYFSIYDRWGNLIFGREDILLSSTDMQWQGRFKDDFVTPGVYVYTGRLLYSTGGAEEFSGHITVVR
jgi:hypothetical protein